MSPSSLTYIDVGAANPIGHSNTYLLYTLGASGFLIEANAKYYPAYLEYRPRDVAMIGCIVTTDSIQPNGLVDFHISSNDGLSSVIQNNACVADAKIISTPKLPAFTFKILLARNPELRSAKLVTIDIEGLDTAVLIDLLNCDIKPYIIIIENNCNEKDMEHREACFARNGFALFATTYVNSVYVSSDLLSMCKF
jgi:hypothetical protein